MVLRGEFYGTRVLLVSTLGRLGFGLLKLISRLRFGLAFQHEQRTAKTVCAALDHQCVSRPSSDPGSMDRTQWPQNI